MASTQHRGHALRLGRWSEAQRIYLVTTYCHARRTIFTCLFCGSMVIDELRRSDDNGGTRTLAYTVMPDHLRWLFELQPGHRLQSVVGQMKGRSALRINKARSTCGRIWQPGFHDHALRKDEVVEVVGDYVVHNPVRAKLVERPEDYPLTYAVWWDKKEM
ncbi:REP-associated tyrosine transposase [Lentisalinibacter orientalis]|uniref:REP-associated tyrosine transposase n=1 Tax=Lentisalinibacter orientalis TaxID=2992241 RepID=UPI0038656FD9